jgi:hypothetical protein
MEGIFDCRIFSFASILYFLGVGDLYYDFEELINGDEKLNLSAWLHFQLATSFTVSLYLACTVLVNLGEHFYGTHKFI